MIFFIIIQHPDLKRPTDMQYQQRIMQCSTYWDRETDSQVGRGADRQGGRQAERETDRCIPYILMNWYRISKPYISVLVNMGCHNYWYKLISIFTISWDFKGGKGPECLWWVPVSLHRTVLLPLSDLLLDHLSSSALIFYISVKLICDNAHYILVFYMHTHKKLFELNQ